MTVADTTLTSQGLATWGFVVKLDGGSGSPQWIQQIGSGTTSSLADDNQVRDLLIDPSDHVYVMGWQGSNPLTIGKSCGSCSKGGWGGSINSSSSSSSRVVVVNGVVLVLGLRTLGKACPPIN